MERIEYRDVIDKSDWQRGEWDAEPDKIQWLHEATGLPCLIVRGPVGALCGYVGVPAWHPLHGVSYSSEIPNSMGNTPENMLDVHGGITFSDRCAQITPERWESWRKIVLAGKDEAEKYPQGDAARRLKEWAGCLDDYEAWTARGHQCFICHIAATGEPDNVWWFGFDCAHGGDICPRMSSLGVTSMMGRYGETYKGVAFLTTECEHLARQLAEAPQRLSDTQTRIEGLRDRDGRR